MPLNSKVIKAHTEYRRIGRILGEVRKFNQAELDAIKKAAAPLNPKPTPAKAPSLKGDARKKSKALAAQAASDLDLEEITKLSKESQMKKKPRSQEITEVSRQMKADIHKIHSKKPFEIRTALFPGGHPARSGTLFKHGTTPKEDIHRRDVEAAQKRIKDTDVAAKEREHVAGGGRTRIQRNSPLKTRVALGKIEHKKTLALAKKKADKDVASAGTKMNDHTQYKNRYVKKLMEGRRKSQAQKARERGESPGARPRHPSSTWTPLGGKVWRRKATGEKTTYVKKGKTPVSPGSPHMRDEPAPIQGPVRAAVRAVGRVLKRKRSQK